MVDLGALAYHRAVADWLEASGQTTIIGDVESRLPRGARRLEGHPAVDSALARAAENLGVRRPVAVYQVEGALNAQLLETGEELAILLSGDLLGLLDEDGLCAVFGHELAHHVLNTLDGGRYGTVGRLLDQLSVDAATPAPYLETARRYALATELFCDRGSVRACGSLPAAVKALVSVDPRPEMAQRARALEEFCSPDPSSEVPAGDEAARALLRPSLDLDRLDVLDRADLEHVTRSLISGFLPGHTTDAVLAHVHQFFPGLAVPPAGSWGSPSMSALPADLSPASLKYLAYVLLDLVVVDPELDLERSVAEGLRYAAAIGLEEPFGEVARTELGLSATAWKRVSV